MFSKFFTACKLSLIIARAWLSVFTVPYGGRYSTLRLASALKAVQPQSSWLAGARRAQFTQSRPMGSHQNTVSDPPAFCRSFAGLINRYLAPLVPWACMTVFCIARPRRSAAEPSSCSVSVIIPARNESGNIQSAVDLTPDLGTTESDICRRTFQRQYLEEIRRVANGYPERKIKFLQQTGKGKGNAVREGFATATGDILMILDADLTMPPEELSKYYDVIASGTADLLNGVRLVYPMQERAMRFLNLCANKLFSIVFTWLLGQSVKDTLCGTKVLRKVDYQMIAANRAYFGDFDPFGDFDLLFGADKLNLKIADVSHPLPRSHLRRDKYQALEARLIVTSDGVIRREETKVPCKGKSGQRACGGVATLEWFRRPERIASARSTGIYLWRAGQICLRSLDGRADCVWLAVEKPVRPLIAKGMFAVAFTRFA